MEPMWDFQCCHSWVWVVGEVLGLDGGGEREQEKGEEQMVGKGKGKRSRRESGERGAGAGEGTQSNRIPA